MFEFIFKRPPGKPEDMPEASAPDVNSEPASPRRVLQAGLLKAVASEEAAADFILQCEFSELRLAAAEQIHSQPQLERVHQAIRNTDRRVAKLLQGRLDALRHFQAEQQKAQACVDQARQLQADEKLTPNHVADLDRRWKVIGAAPELGQRFAEIRAALSQRLEAQVALQRAMIDAVNALRQLPASSMTPDELVQRIDDLAAQHNAALAAPEAASLPRHLIGDFAQELAQLKNTLATRAQHQSAFQARESALAVWLGADPASLSTEQLQRAWQGMAALPEGEPAARLQLRFDALLAALAPARKEARPPKAPKPAAATRQADQHFLDTLEAMEAALQQGSLQSAAEFDKVLKDSKGVHLSPAQSERLASVRAELKRLSAWARWGGNVSREELVKAVEELAAQRLPMADLAKKVGSLRERWKSLDALSGSAPKALWEKFDAACGAAYAPAAAHFKQLADERHANAAKAQALVAEAQQAAAAVGDDTNWKAMAAKVQHLRQAWTRLGTIDRKDKKRLDSDFARALSTLQAPLEQQRKSEVSVREQLIAEVGELNPNDRHTIDALRGLQERWQEHARALPLERKAEQALWQRFRAACDAVFAKRKATAHAADAERHAHEDAKTALCARLEAAAASEEGDDKARAAAASRLIREAAEEWRSIGAVPRAHEAKVEKRYHAAVAALQSRVDTAKRSAGAAQANALRDRLRLIHELEAGVAGNGAADADWQGRWSALPALHGEFERVLRGRFNAALLALAGERRVHAAVLEQNRAALLQDILRLEIAAGVDSGAEFARERLKMQVEVLQASLKSGQKHGSHLAELQQLVARPALTDARSATRIEQLLRRIGTEGK